jgi:outer membrane protein
MSNKAMKRKSLLIACIALVPWAGYAQDSQTDYSPIAQSLPAAPMPQAAPGRATPNADSNGKQSSSFLTNLPPDHGMQTPLSLKQAETLALKNNPQISVAGLMALASHQVTREVRSNLWPTATGAFTAVTSQDNSRITAGGLNNPIIYQRAAAGVMVSQLITDFGRTTNLISSANLAAKAEDQTAAATKEQVLLAVDQAFYNALQAHAVLTVAQQTVSARQTVADQVEALFKSKLKSELDFSFANVNLAQAKLLVLDAENNENAALATLSMVLGYSRMQDFHLVEDTTAISSPPSNVDDLISEAFAARPEILSLEFQEQSAQKFHTAERDLLLPNIRAVGAVGDTPVGDPVLSNWYGAVGVNVEVPLFNGFLYSARSREASLKAQVAHDRLLDLRNRISRDVRTGWLNANTAYARVSVTQQLLNQASLALDLATTRYRLGLSSIVELSQAQLQQTQAEIGNAQAGYDYRLALAVLRFQTTGY